MPLKNCTVNGKQGWKWGDEGTCYTSKEDALAQGRAIEASKLRDKYFKFNETYNDYPESAKENARIALRWAEENGWGSCGTPVGKARANQLAKGESISRDTIARMAAFGRNTFIILTLFRSYVIVILVMMVLLMFIPLTPTFLI
jgi:hypothetical protein